MALTYGGGILPNVYDSYRMKKAKREGTIIADSVVSNIVSIQSNYAEDSEVHRALSGILQEVYTRNYTSNSMSAHSYMGYPLGGSAQINVHAANVNANDDDEEQDGDPGDGVGMGTMVPTRVNIRGVGERVPVENENALTKYSIKDDTASEGDYRNVYRRLTNHEVDLVVAAFKYGNGNDRIKVMGKVLRAARRRDPLYEGNVRDGLTRQYLANFYLPRFRSTFVDIVATGTM